MVSVDKRSADGPTGRRLVLVAPNRVVESLSNFYMFPLGPAKPLVRRLREVTQFNRRFLGLLDSAEAEAKAEEDVAISDIVSSFESYLEGVTPGEQLSGTATGARLEVTAPVEVVEEGTAPKGMLLAIGP